MQYKVAKIMATTQCNNRAVYQWARLVDDGGKAAAYFLNFDLQQWAVISELCVWGKICDCGNILIN